MQTERRDVRSMLLPHQRFMLDYGCFLVFWGNFELYMEGLIWHLRTTVSRENINCLTNCREINTLTAGRKRDKLIEFLLKANRQDVIDALKTVFDAGNRNEWVHGHILMPDRQSEKLSRFRVCQKTGRVENQLLDLYVSPLDAFNPEYIKFEDLVTSTLGFGMTECNNYINTVVLEQEAKGQSQPNSRSPR